MATVTLSERLLEAKDACHSLALVSHLRYGDGMEVRTLHIKADPKRIRRVMGSVAYGPRGAADLNAIAIVFNVSQAEIGTIFGVERQAVQQWFRHGVPAERRASVARVAQAARALHDYFKAGRIPQIVREPLPNQDGSTILDLARRDPLKIVELVRRTRSYVPTP